MNKLKRVFHAPSIKVTLKTLTAIIIVGSGFIGWRVYAAESSITGNKNPLAVLSVFTPAQLKETSGRVNVLVAGYSADDPGHNGAQLTDSIMILSIDPTTKQEYVLSVPRDLWVDIPGFGYSKINAAYPDGQSEGFAQDNYFSGGMGLLQEVIQDNLGIQLNYYSLINYTAVKDAVNAVGGVSVTINSSDPRGLYDPYTNLNLPNGTVTLDGQTALNLIRARGDGPGSYGFGNGDFDRIKNQQLVLLALKSKTSSLYSNPLKLVSLINALGSNVQTNMQLNEIETFYSLVKGVNELNIKTYSLQNINGQQLLNNYTSYNGQSALVPAAGASDFRSIQTTIQNLGQ
jgi:polyisoprenyl-teichoic acid--peptidoglycan teichoic acid transferase